MDVRVAVLVVLLVAVFASRVRCAPWPTSLYSRLPAANMQVGLPITYNRKWGVFTAQLRIGGRRHTVVVDTGSRHLVVRGPVDGGAPSPGPAVLYYGSQTEHVDWRTVTLGISDRPSTIAVTHRRTGSTDFNILGLGIAHGRCTASSERGCVSPFITQIMRHPRFCIQMRTRERGVIVFNDVCRAQYTLPLLPDWKYYGTPLHGVTLVLPDGTSAPLPHAPNKLLVDTGSNMLGCHPRAYNALKRAMQQGARIVLHLKQTSGAAMQLELRPDTYRWGDGTLLLDPHELPLPQTLVLGSLFMKGMTLSFDPLSKTLGIG